MGLLKSKFRNSATLWSFQVYRNRQPSSSSSAMGRSNPGGPDLDNFSMTTSATMCGDSSQRGLLSSSGWPSSSQRSTSEAKLHDKRHRFRAVHIGNEHQRELTGELDVTQTELVFWYRGRDGQHLAYRWPISGLRKYGCGKGFFTFECGRRCATGEGIFLFKCKKSRRVHERLMEEISKIRGPAVERERVPLSSFFPALPSNVRSRNMDPRDLVDSGGTQSTVVQQLNTAAPDNRYTRHSVFRSSCVGGNHNSGTGSDLTRSCSREPDANAQSALTTSYHSFSSTHFNLRPYNVYHGGGTSRSSSSGGTGSSFSRSQANGGAGVGYPEACYGGEYLIAAPEPPERHSYINQPVLPMTASITSSQEDDTTVYLELDHNTSFPTPQPAPPSSQPQSSAAVDYSLLSLPPPSAWPPSTSARASSSSSHHFSSSVKKKDVC